MLVDRITGERWDGSSFVAGQLIEQSRGQTSYVVGDRRGVVRLQDARHTILDGDDRLSDRTLDAHAEAILAAPLTWDGIATVSLVAPEVDAPRRLERLLEAVHQNLPHLAHVLHAPRSRLRDEERLVPVGRARKPARGATQRLAGHSEDWFTRGVRSVRPKRVLTRRVDLDVDLYENRIAITLLEEMLPAAIRHGIRDLRELEEGYGELTDALMDDSTFQRQWRLSSLWDSSTGQSDVFDAYERLLSIIDQANAMRGRLRRLGGAPLVAELSGKRPPVGPLRQTNLLSDDAHYRGTADLWRLVTSSSEQQESETARAERVRRRHRAIAVLVVALVARTLRQVGFGPVTECDIESGLSLAGPAGEIRLQLDETDVISLRRGEFEHRFVPLIADLERASVDHVPEQTTVVYLGSGRDHQRHAFDRHGKPTVVPVNLLEPVSTERIGRVVFDLVLGPVISAYPTVIQRDGQVVAPKLRQELAGHEPIEEDGEHVKMVRPIGPSDQAAFTSWFDDVKRRAKGPSWERDHLGHLRGLTKALDDAAEALERLLVCPSCGHKVDHRSFEVRGGTSYRVACPGCRTLWGTSVCGSCRGTFATLALASAAVHDPIIRSPRDLERLLGRDQFASPCWAAPANGADFICPDCSTCTADGAASSLDCARCSVQVSSKVDS